MRQLVVISGKGGTGKTTVTASLAQLLKPLVIADCDVEAPNLHLLLSPRVERNFPLTVSKKAVIEEAECDECGKCIEGCHFHAILPASPPRVDPFRCEGCKVCQLVCPRGAIDMVEPAGADVMIGDTAFGPMVGARLAVGEEASGKVVTRVRAEAQLVALENGLPLILIDGSPGTGCPVIASLSGADIALVVTEPTVAARHDLQRILELTAHFGIQTMVCLNKWDINPEMAKSVIEDCRQNDLEVLAEIPYRQEVVEALRKGLPPLGNTSADIEIPLRQLADGIQSVLAPS